ncbi:MAG: recombination-associated protein RdgC [Syntrophobacteraceae bacterium]|nr:recombination-associated protein RdgC [Syntrophobacteraceae bacterium]
MAISSSSATITRFFVPEPDVGDFWSYVDEKLRAGAFAEPDDTRTEAAGFTSWEDFFDPSFSYGSYRKGEYVAFNFRLDQKKVPAVVLKQFVRQSVQKYRDEHEGKWPSRSEKQEMQENMQEYLLSRAFPQPSSFEVVWEPARNLLVLGTSSAKMLDAFLEFFERQFQVYPVPLFHAQWAANMLALTPGQKDTLGSIVSLKSPTALSDGRFLGTEFLTWVWYYIECLGGSIQAGEKTAELHLGERMTLLLPRDGKERVVCTSQANFLHEARTALRQGKVVDEVQLLLIIGENEYVLTLDSSLWAVKGLKTPKQLPDYGSEDPDGRFLEKMYFIQEVFEAMDSLYMRFLAERLTPGWESDTLVELQKWIDEGRSAPETAQSPTAIA